LEIDRPEIARYYKEAGILKTIPCFMYFTKFNDNYKTPNVVLCSSDKTKIEDFFKALHSDYSAINGVLSFGDSF
jgi:hypothetical protein